MIGRKNRNKYKIEYYYTWLSQIMIFGWQKDIIIISFDDNTQQ